MKSKVIIIEDNEDLRDAYAHFISKDNKYHVINSFDAVESAIDYINLNEDYIPDILLLDIKLKGINGIKGCEYFNDKYPSIKIIMISVHDGPEYVFQALKAGATGYLTKNLNEQKLLQSLDEVLAGGAPMSSQIAKMVIQSFQVKKHKIDLNTKEGLILNILASGRSYQAIADEIGISKDTVKYHIKNIYKKLQASNKLEAINKAQQLGIID